MKIPKSLLTAAVAAVALAASASAFAQCAAKPDVFALLKKGQGNLACSDFFGPNGVVMQNASVCGTVDISISGSTASWSINSMTQECTGDVFVANRADGQSCVYNYQKDTIADGNLTAPESSSIKDGIVCTDLQLVADPVSPDSDPPPVVTDNGCSNTTLQAAVENQDASSGVPIDVLLGVGTSEDGSTQQLAVCTDQSTNQPTTLEQCVDRCETVDGWPLTVGKHSPDCTGEAEFDPNAFPMYFSDGRLPIACRRCATSGAPDFNPPTGPNIPAGTQYCWELESRVAETADGLTFRNPNGSTSGAQFTVQRLDGTVCYKISGQTSGGYPYSYYAPAGCPCDPSVDATCVNIQF